MNVFIESLFEYTSDALEFVLLLLLPAPLLLQLLEHGIDNHSLLLLLLLH